KVKKMKSIDVDAKHLIRTYIDGIEEYLREHTRLHPNEIDALLNEINDFIYLRSGELASEDRVHYNDVLRAIEECGSPSEICEQYLELDKEEEPGPFTPKIVPSSSKPQIGTSPKAGLKPSNDQKVIPMELHDEVRGIRTYYRGFPRFTIYRICFLFFIVLLDSALFNYNSILGGTAWYWTRLSINPEIILEFGYDNCLTATFTALFLVFWEGFVIHRWKIKLAQEKGFNRHFDDSLIVWFSRFSFLLLFFKSSLLYFSAYLLYVPIWLILACIIERQMKSNFWDEKIGPWLISLGSTLTGSQKNQVKITSYWTQFKDQLTREEKWLVLMLLGMLVVTFLFPWIGFESWESQYIGPLYDVSSLPMFAVIFASSSLLVMVVTLGALRYFKIKNPSFRDPEAVTGGSELITWLMRLLALKAILILDFSNDPVIVYFGVFSIVIVLIASEIISNTYGGKRFKLWFGKTLVMLGSSSSVPRLNGSSQQLSTSHTIDQSSVIKSEAFVSYSQEPTDVALQRKGVTTESREQVLFTKTVETDKKPSMISSFFKGIGEVVKAFVLTIFMLFISFFEVVLTFIVIIISLSYSGSFEVPVLEFNGGYFSLFLIYSSSSSNIVFIVTMWHTLLLLGIQLFFIVTLQWYGLATKKPEGIILKVCRNLTRILLGVVIIGVLVHYFYGDLYSSLKLLIAFGLVFFSELTAWKVRSERKKLNFSTKEQKLPIHENEGITLERSDLTKAS
ncbi:MAG: hypothetical protein ACFFDT_27805, partial [Candidatus Hodarchaeota archaeon]